MLADKPWLVEPSDLEDLRRSLDARPLVIEMMTGRHDVTARLMKRVVDTPDVFGPFFTDGPTIELESVDHLEKLVDGAPLRRPWSLRRARAGTGAVNIPTHLVDQTQWLVDGGGDRAARLRDLRGAGPVRGRTTGRVSPHHRRADRFPPRWPRSRMTMRFAISAMSR